MSLLASYFCLKQIAKYYNQTNFSKLVVRDNK